MKFMIKNSASLQSLRLQCIVAFVVLLALSLSGCSGSSTEPVSSQKDSIADDNQQAKETTSLRLILSDSASYVDQDVIIGPLKATGNELKEGYLRTYISTGSKSHEYDIDAGIYVYYNNTPDKAKWVDLYCDERPIIYVYGTIKRYSNRDNIYIDAIEISEKYEAKWVEQLKQPSSTKPKEPDQSSIDELVISLAKSVVLNNLKAPGSARFLASEILDKDNYGRYFVKLQVDAQNSFGALIRKTFYVVLQSIDTENRTCTYNPLFGVNEIDSSNNYYYSEANIKKSNDWDTPRDKKDVQPAIDTDSDRELAVLTAASEYMKSQGLSVVLLEPYGAPTVGDLVVSIYKMEQNYAEVLVGQYMSEGYFTLIFTLNSDGKWEFKEKVDETI